MRMHTLFSITSHSKVQGCIHCCNHCALTAKVAQVTKSACQKALKDHSAATSLGQLPHWCLAAGAGTSQLELQQPLEHLGKLLAATQQVKELCVSAGAVHPMTSFLLAMTGTPCSHAFWTCNAMHTHKIMLLVLQVVQMIHICQHAPCCAALVWELSLTLFPIGK